VAWYSAVKLDRELEITKFKLEGCNCIFHACMYILDGG